MLRQGTQVPMIRRGQVSGNNIAAHVAHSPVVRDTGLCCFQGYAVALVVDVFDHFWPSVFGIANQHGDRHPNPVAFRPIEVLVENRLGVEFSNNVGSGVAVGQRLDKRTDINACVRGRFHDTRFVLLA